MGMGCCSQRTRDKSHRLLFFFSFSSRFGNFTLTVCEFLSGIHRWKAGRVVRRLVFSSSHRQDRGRGQTCDDVSILRGFASVLRCHATILRYMHRVAVVPSKIDKWYQKPRKEERRHGARGTGGVTGCQVDI